MKYFLARLMTVLIAVLLPAPLMVSAEPADYSWRTAWWSTDRESSKENGLKSTEIWVRQRQRVSEAMDVHFEAWGQLQNNAGNSLNGDLTEAYVKYGVDAFDVRIGRQAIAWGRADRINPTDVFGVRDYSRRVADDNDNRQGVGAAKLTISKPWAQLAVLIVPEFRPTTLPTGEDHHFGRDFKRRVPDRSAQFGVRMDHIGRAVDWAISAAYYNSRIGFLVPPVPSAGTLPVEYYFPKTVMIGGDFATEAHGFGFRGELAYSRPDVGANKHYISGGPALTGVIGTDRTFDQGLNINLQLIAVSTDRRSCAVNCALPGLVELRNANDQRQQAWRHVVTGGSVRARYDFAFDTAFVEAAVLAYDGGGSVLQARFGFKFTDQIALRAGADIYSGQRSDLFGSLRENNGAFVELRRGY